MFMAAIMMSSCQFPFDTEAVYKVGVSTSSRTWVMKSTVGAKHSWNMKAPHTGSNPGGMGLSHCGHNVTECY